jgi:NhaP-type Na+/H+ or K+/H+ antiporter
MELAALCLTLVAIVLWAGISTRAAVISTPIFFVAIGLVLAEGLHLFDVETDSHQVKIIAEVTLVWVLFADASRIRISDLRADLGRCIRLLGLGLPLTIAFGAVAGYRLFGISPWYALLLGAALAPTDAALGSAVMSDQRVPQPVRRVLNVESGLNDGIATPVVMVALAGIATEAGLAGHETPGRALLGLLLGALIGVGVGAGGGLLLRQTRRRGWSSEEFAGPAVLALSLLAYLSAALAGANGDPSASFFNNSRSCTRIRSRSTRSRSAGAICPLNLLPGNSITIQSIGPSSSTPWWHRAPCVHASHHPQRVKHPGATFMCPLRR